MASPPIPQRFPPLRWRAPAFVWTPLALFVSIGWPAALFYNGPSLQRLLLIAGASTFAIALATLGVTWALGQAPRWRRVVVLHVVIAGGVVALGAPFVLTELLGAIADYQNAGSGRTFTFAMSLAMTPLALVLGLPIALISGLLFSWVALVRPRLEEDVIGIRGDVQPFR